MAQRFTVLLNSATVTALLTRSRTLFQHSAFSRQTLEIDEADFHIPTASAAAARRIISSKPDREGIRLLGIRPFIYIYKVGPN
jgi:hypothetical protein